MALLALAAQPGNCTASAGSSAVSGCPPVVEVQPIALECTPAEADQPIMIALGYLEHGVGYDNQPEVVVLPTGTCLDCHPQQYLLGPAKALAGTDWQRAKWSLWRDWYNRVASMSCR